MSSGRLTRYHRAVQFSPDRPSQPTAVARRALLRRTAAHGVRRGRGHVLTAPGVLRYRQRRAQNSRLRGARRRCPRPRSTAFGSCITRLTTTVLTAVLTRRVGRADARIRNGPFLGHHHDAEIRPVGPGEPTEVLNAVRNSCRSSMPASASSPIAPNMPVRLSIIPENARGAGGCFPTIESIVSGSSSRPERVAGRGGVDDDAVEPVVVDIIQHEAKGRGFVGSGHRPAEKSLLTADRVLGLTCARCTACTSAKHPVAAEQFATPPSASSSTPSGPRRRRPPGRSPRRTWMSSRMRVGDAGISASSVSDRGGQAP